MIIREVRVKNFRSILDESLHCDFLTALVGRNGAGKSSFLRAMEVFYDPSARVSSEDFYSEDSEQDIEIAVTFYDLEDDEREFFSDYIDNETLTVVLVRSEVPGKITSAYHGMRLQNPDFVDVRKAPNKTEVKNRYNELKSRDEYVSLPSISSADQAKDAMKQWEVENPGQCIRLRDDGQFFGFTEVAQGYLGRYTRFIRIPAVRDALDDATEKKGSCVTEIMDLVVRSVLANKEDVTAFKEEVQAKHKQIFDPTTLTELVALENQLSNTLQYYVPDAGVTLEWAELISFNIPMPTAGVKLLEDGYESSVQRTGHGLQRAFILTMLQHLVAAREHEREKTRKISSTGDSSVTRRLHGPNLIMAIDEPELYQHPSRQRHMGAVLLKLAKGSIPGVARRTQVIYSTHAPLFVGLDRFDQIRLLRKRVNADHKPKITEVRRVDLDEVATDLWNLGGRKGEKYTADTLRPRMQAVMTPWVNEGFFGDTVVLVEGESDRAAILATANLMKYDLESMGICVIPCMSKNNLDRPAIVFRKFGIRTYLIWDNDKGTRDADPSENRRLLKLVGAEEQDWPDGIRENHSCLECKLEHVLRQDLSEPVFDNLLDEARSEFRMKKDQALKNPFIVKRIIEEAAKQGHVSNTLNAVVGKIIEFHEQ